MRRSAAPPSRSRSPGNGSNAPAAAATTAHAGAATAVPPTAVALALQVRLSHPDVGAALRAAAVSGGRPLAASDRERAEHYFGQPLGDVRIHDDPAAGTAAEALDARAFAQQERLYFASDGLPSDPAARDELLIHELAHAAEASRFPSASVEPADSPHERWARRSAADFRQGAARARGPRPLAAGLARDVDPVRDEIRRAIADQSAPAIVTIAADPAKRARTTPAERAGMIRILTDLLWTGGSEELATLQLLREAGENAPVVALLDAIGYRPRVLDSVDDESLHAELEQLLGSPSPAESGDASLDRAIAGADTAFLLGYGNFRGATHSQRLGALRVLLSLNWSDAGEERVIVDLLESAGDSLPVLVRDLRGLGLLEALFDHIDDDAEAVRLTALLAPLATTDEALRADLGVFQRNGIWGLLTGVGGGFVLAVENAWNHPGRLLLGLLEPLLFWESGPRLLFQAVDLIQTVEVTRLDWWTNLVTFFRDAAGVISVWLLALAGLCGGLALLTSETVIGGLTFAALAANLLAWATGFGVAFLVLAGIRLVLDGIGAAAATTARQDERATQRLAEDWTLAALSAALFGLIRGLGRGIQGLRDGTAARTSPDPQVGDRSAEAVREGDQAVREAADQGRDATRSGEPGSPARGTAGAGEPWTPPEGVTAGHELLGSLRDHVVRMGQAGASPEAMALEFQRGSALIERLTGGSWQARMHAGADGGFYFTGESQGRILAISPDGRVYGGLVGLETFRYGASVRETTVNYETLRCYSPTPPPAAPVPATPTTPPATTASPSSLPTPAARDLGRAGSAAGGGEEDREAATR